jgi:hypothetical protein
VGTGRGLELVLEYGLILALVLEWRLTFARVGGGAGVMTEEQTGLDISVWGKCWSTCAGTSAGVGERARVGVGAEIRKVLRGAGARVRVNTGAGARVGVDIGVSVGCSSKGVRARVCCGFLCFHLLMD